jgi:putative PIG3 family NAD(P)H quinone oxidoreductase
VKAIVVDQPGPPEVLRLAEIARPEPGPGELLIEVAGSGVNRADLMQRQGHYPPPPGASEIIGLEVAGTVAALGADTSGWAVGDPCVALLAGGGYAEFVAVPFGQVVPPPPGLSAITAAGVIEVAGTVYANLSQAGLASGETFLIHGGAGGIGSFAIQYAKTLGATVIATAGSTEKLEQCRALGADHAVSYRDDWPAEIDKITDGAGVDVVLDNMGAKYLEQHVGLLKPNGRLMVIGMQGGTKGTLDLGLLMRKRGSVTATSLRARPVQEKAQICSGVVEQIWPLIADGTITIAPPQVFPLADAARAHARMESGESSGKIVLAVS